MGFPALFSKRSVRGGRRTTRRPQRRRSERLGWETLGYGLGGHEALEQRTLMAADLSLSFDDNLVAGIERTFASPGMQVVYTLKVTNNGPDTATDALVQTTLGIKNATWTAVYTGEGTGLFGGAGNLGSHAKIAGQANSTAFSTTVTLPSKATATFRIVGTVAADATGTLSSSASVTLAGDPNPADNSKTDTDTLVPRSIAVGGNGSWTSTSTVKLVQPDSKGTAVAGPVTPFAGVRSGVRSVLVDLTGDGKDELVTVANYGGAGKVVVFSQKVAGDGTVTLEKAAGYDSVVPFGSGARGMSVAAGDFDGDGLEDLAFAQAAGDEVRLYRSTPTAVGGPLTFLKAFTPLGRNVGVGAIAAGDFGTFDGTASDGVRTDGKDELVVVGTSAQAPVAKIFQVAGTTPSVIDTLTPFTTRTRSDISVEVARLNVGSTPDLIFSAGAGGGSAVEMYDGTIGDAANTKLATLAAFSGIGSGRPVFSAAIDTDGDTRADTLEFVQGGGSTTPLVRYSVAAGSTAGSISVTKIDTVSGVAGSLRAAAAAAASDPTLIGTTSGLIYKELKKGTGDAFTSGKTGVRVNYEGYNSDGDRFDAGTDASFSLSGVIPGFAEGLKTMRVGGKSEFIIPPSLAYGNGAPSNGKPIIFVVDLLAFTP